MFAQQLGQKTVPRPKHSGRHECSMKQAVVLYSNTCLIYSLLTIGGSVQCTVVTKLSRQFGNEDSIFKRTSSTLQFCGSVLA